MPQLHLEVLAGLGNRIRSMVSGICAAEELGIPLVIHWNPVDSACVCHIEAIFNPISLPGFVYRSPIPLLKAEECLSVETWGTIVSRWDKESDIYIRSYGKFYGGTKEKEDLWLTHLRDLRPTPHIEEEVNKRLSMVNLKEALGIHIRGGDNHKSREASPFWAFQRHLFEDKSKYFVVASDEVLLKERLQQQFMDKCVFAARFADRKTEQGMVEAAVDFFALAKCPRILGSAWSSFSHMAALYGGSELILANAD